MRGLKAQRQNPQEKEVTDGNFQIAGVALTGGQFKQLVAKLVQ
jgi:hypothetical protein